MIDSKPSSVLIVANQPLFMEHLTGEFHPESPHRVEAIEEALKNAGLMDENNTIIPREATLDEISLCHDQAYIEELKRQIEILHSLRLEHAHFDCIHWHVDRIAGDFIISPKTFHAALHAAGAPLTAIETILNRDNLF